MPLSPNPNSRLNDCKCHISGGKSSDYQDRHLYYICKSDYLHTTKVIRERRIKKARWRSHETGSHTTNKVIDGYWPRNKWKSGLQNIEEHQKIAMINHCFMYLFSGTEATWISYSSDKQEMNQTATDNQRNKPRSHSYAATAMPILKPFPLMPMNCSAEIFEAINGCPRWPTRSANLLQEKKPLNHARDLFLFFV